MNTKTKSELCRFSRKEELCLFIYFATSVIIYRFPSGGQARESTAVPSVPAEEDERPAGQHSGRI